MKLWASIGLLLGEQAPLVLGAEGPASDDSLQQGAPRECSTSTEGGACVAPRHAHGLSTDQVLLQQHGLLSSRAARGCTEREKDPWGTGQFTPCCQGSAKELGQWDGHAWSFRCIPSGPVLPRCTGDDADPWSTGDYIECCDGLQKQLGQWSGSDWSFRCQGSPDAPQPAPAPEPVPAPPSEGSSVIFYEWNVHWQNRNYHGIADIIRMTQPDIVGLCELTGDPHAMAAALSQAMSPRTFAVQPGRHSHRWIGYGTDILYDSGKWEALEGDVSPVHCASHGGPRAANWVVLRERQTGKKLITGGLHTSYCAQGCDWLHECELGAMYSQFEGAKARHGQEVPVVWMGDINRNTHTHIMQNVFRGRLGGRQVFGVDDIALTQGNTYYSGGRAIDFIVGETGKFHRQRGGRTGQGTTGRHLNGADHFPVYAEVDML